MTDDNFGLIQEPATKTGSRWTGAVTAVDAFGHRIGSVPVRPCKTKRELSARADILAAKLSAAPGYQPDAVI